MQTSDRKKRLPVWVRTILMLVLVIIGSGIWGFGAVAMGVPTILVAFGALVISWIGIVWAFGDKESQDSN